MNATIARVRHTPGGVDQYGDPISGTTTETTMSDWFVAPRTSDDIPGRARDGVTVGLNLYTPYDADLVRTDQVKVNGEVYDIDGEIARWKHPWTGWEAGQVAALKRGEG